MKESTKRLSVAAFILVVLPLLGLCVLIARNVLSRQATEARTNETTLVYSGLKRCEVHKITVDEQEYILVKYHGESVAICPVPPKPAKR